MSLDRDGGAEGSAPASEKVVGQARNAVAGMVLFAVVLFGLVHYGGIEFPLGGLALPVGLIGLISPVVCFRLYVWLRERVPPNCGAQEIARRFLLATSASVGIAAFVAAVGIASFSAADDWSTLTGLATLLLLAGAIWPSEVKLAQFAEVATTGSDTGGEP